MEQIQMTRKISLPPKHLDRDVKTHIYNKLVVLFKEQCSQQNGYVINVEPDVTILGNELVSNGSVLFEVEFFVQTLKPKKGQVLEGTVCMVFDGGIFVEIYGKMKVLVPTSRILKYKFDKDTGTFKRKKHVISQGDNISVKLDQIQYIHKGFNCIGVLVI